jgi:hypothetical protein
MKIETLKYALNLNLYRFIFFNIQNYYSRNATLGKGIITANRHSKSHRPIINTRSSEIQSIMI